MTRKFYAEASAIILATAFALAMLLAVTACSPASNCAGAVVAAQPGQPIAKVGDLG